MEASIPSATQVSTPRVSSGRSSTTTSSSCSGIGDRTQSARSSPSGFVPTPILRRGYRFERSAGAIAFTRNLLTAFFPAVVLGLALGSQIDALLENAVVVAWALIIGGIAILVIEKWANPPARPDIPDDQVGGAVATMSFSKSLKIGLVQCLAMIPGVSRSGATIMGAMAMGVDRKTAAEFSFFLAVPTLTGATALQMFKAREDITVEGLQWIGLGALVSFVVAYIVVKAFMAIVTRYGFAPFAWYRIVVGGAARVWLGAI